MREPITVLISFYCIQRALPLSAMGNLFLEATRPPIPSLLLLLNLNNTCKIVEITPTDDRTQQLLRIQLSLHL